MQLQKSVSALQVDGSKSHTIFSILWSISLALCWYSWSIASSDPWKCMCNPYFPEPCQQFQRILMSVKDNNNFLCVLSIIALLFLDSYLLSLFLSPCARSTWRCQWLTIYLENLLSGLAAAKDSVGAMRSGFYHFRLSLSHSLAAVFIPCHIFRSSHAVTTK